MSVPASVPKRSGRRVLRQFSQSEIRNRESYSSNSTTSPIFAPHPAGIGPLRQVAVVVVGIGDGPAFGVRGRGQTREAVVSEGPGLRALGDPGQVVEGAVAVGGPLVGRADCAQGGSGAGQGLGGNAEVTHLHSPPQIIQPGPGPSRLRRPPVGIRGGGGARGPRPQVVGRHLDAGRLRLVGVL